MTDDPDEQSVERPSPGEIHAHDSAVDGIAADRNRMLGRRPPTGTSDSGLVSRDYQPRTGGPELLASWPLGPAPSQEEPGDVDWVVRDKEYAVLQKNVFVMPYAGPVDYSMLYLCVCGWARVDGADAELSLKLEHSDLSGKPYETTVPLANEDRTPFLSPMVELSPDSQGAWENFGNLSKMYTGYVLSGKASGGVGYLDQGTNVQLWCE